MVQQTDDIAYDIWTNKQTHTHVYCHFLLTSIIIIIIIIIADTGKNRPTAETQFSIGLCNRTVQCYTRLLLSIYFVIYLYIISFKT